ncbi:MAG: type II methionyl aminopeptidase [Nanoarchaeota archaeon]
MNQQDISKTIKAGQIASQTKVYARTIVKKGVPLLEIAEKIESKIVELGGKPAFPVNLSIDNIAAHYTPSHDDKTLAHGLLKVDLGVHIGGFVADTAFSLDLENNEENKKLIKASEEALEKALSLVKSKGIEVRLSEVGKVIQNTIESHGFSPVTNLSGHSIEKYNLHAGDTVPNIDNNGSSKFKEGIYAIEPFTTNGNGKVHDGAPSGIYELVEERNTRSPIAREVLTFIQKEYETLPFCSRWIVKALGTKALFGLRELESNGIIHQFTQLVEAQGTKVSQAEQTILIEKGKVTVTSL